MSEEEKKAIEFLKEIVLEFEKYNSEYVIDKDDEYGFLNSFKVVLNLIEEQQKEIDQLKQITKAYNSFKGNMNGETKIIIGDSRYFDNGTFLSRYISKDKIRDKIKEYERIKECFQVDEWKREYNYRIETLKQLLEEK